MWKKFEWIFLIIIDHNNWILFVDYPNINYNLWNLLEYISRRKLQPLHLLSVFICSDAVNEFLFNRNEPNQSVTSTSPIQRDELPVLPFLRFLYTTDIVGGLLTFHFESQLHSNFGGLLKKSENTCPWRYGTIITKCPLCTTHQRTITKWKKISFHFYLD